MAKALKNNNYKIIGYKKTKIKKTQFKMYYGNQLHKFVQSLDVLINVLPNTDVTINFIPSSYCCKDDQMILIYHLLIIKKLFLQ